MTPARVVYLHGFASTPRAHKATLFATALAERGVPVEIPDLNEDSFRDLTLTRQLSLLERCTAADPPGSGVLIGSSLGGYAAALHAAGSPAVGGMVLMAPAFDFHRRWAEQLGPASLEEWRQRGFMLVFHHGYGRLEPVRFSLLEDAALHPAFPPIRVPTLIFHGRADVAPTSGVAGSCTVTVDVTAPLAGSFLNTLAADSLQTDPGHNVAPVVAAQTVTTPNAHTPAPAPTSTGCPAKIG
jgi:pimeloyl-ACP methyl ester carboxylesterase